MDWYYAFPLLVGYATIAYFVVIFCVSFMDALLNQRVDRLGRAKRQIDKVAKKAVKQMQAVAALSELKNAPMTHYWRVTSVRWWR